MPRMLNILAIAGLLMVGTAIVFPVHATPGTADRASKSATETKAKPEAQPTPTTKPAAGASKTSAPKPASQSVKLTQQQIDTAIEILREQNPELAERIDDALTRHPEQVSSLISANWSKLAKLAEMKQRDPKLFELTMEDIKLTRRAMELAAKIREAGPDPDRTKTARQRAELRDMVNRRYENRQNIRRLEIENLQKRIGEIRQTIESKNRVRDDLVRKRVDELIATGKETPGEF